MAPISMNGPIFHIMVIYCYLWWRVYEEHRIIVPSIGNLRRSLPLARIVFVMITVNGDCHDVHLIVCSTK